MTNDNIHDEAPTTGPFTYTVIDVARKYLTAFRTWVDGDGVEQVGASVRVKITDAFDALLQQPPRQETDGESHNRKVMLIHSVRDSPLGYTRTTSGNKINTPIVVASDVNVKKLLELTESLEATDGPRFRQSVGAALERSLQPDGQPSTEGYQFVAVISSLESFGSME